jgi:hypothetical protein
MQGLSYGVVRVNTEDSLTSLTLQDCGQVLPGGNAFSFCCVHNFVGLQKSSVTNYNKIRLESD